MSPEHEFLPSSNSAAPAPHALPVLIVDDDRDILEMLGDVLEEAGFMVLTARDGKAALNLLARLSLKDRAVLQHEIVTATHSPSRSDVLSGEVHIASS